MDWNRVEGSWKQVKGKIKEQWGKLTDDDLDVINGRRDQLEGRSKSGTATPRIKLARKWTIGTPRKDGDRDLSLTSNKGWRRSAPQFASPFSAERS